MQHGIKFLIRLEIDLMSILKLFVDTFVSFFFFFEKGGNYYLLLKCEYNGFRLIDDHSNKEKNGKWYGQSSTIIFSFNYS